MSDQKHGHGTETVKSRGTYSGSFKQGKRDGKGKLTLKNGDHYEGGFKENQYHGEGTFWQEKTKTRSTGSFANGTKHG